MPATPKDIAYQAGRYTVRLCDEIEVEEAMYAIDEDGELFDESYSFDDAFDECRRLDRADQIERTRDAIETALSILDDDDDATLAKLKAVFAVLEI